MAKVAIIGHSFVKRFHFWLGKGGGNFDFKNLQFIYKFESGAKVRDLDKLEWWLKMQKPQIILMIGENDIQQDTVPSVLATKELVDKSEKLSRWGGKSMVLIGFRFPRFYVEEYKYFQQYYND